MDFDDMPDSYFAFLSNQKKLAEADKINGAMRDLGRGSEPEASKTKLRSRTSQPNLSSGSKPSVPSLPSIQRTNTPPPPMLSSTGGRGFAKPLSRPQLGAKPQTGPMAPSSRASGQGALGQIAAAHQSSPGPGTPLSLVNAMTQPSGPIPRTSNFAFGAQSMTAPAAAPSRSNTLVLLLITILVAAIGVLAYLVFTK
jgi:hypothetical protein